MAMNNFVVVYQDEAILVVNKARGVATSPIVGSLLPNLCGQVFSHYPQLANIKGFKAIEGGLLHRLDNDTAGLVLFAKTQEAFNFLANEAQEGRFVKYYCAQCRPAKAMLSPAGITIKVWQQLLNSNSLGEPCYSLTTAFVKAQANSAKVRAIGSVSNSKKATRPYRTQFRCAFNNKNELWVMAKLRQGFRHQVRASLAGLGLPIKGDPLYDDSAPNVATPFYFWATGLTFKHPQSCKLINISNKPPI
jgi:23S rRNA pseudouridine1911/1915/1917 synthase